MGCSSSNTKVSAKYEGSDKKSEPGGSIKESSSSSKKGSAKKGGGALRRSITETKINQALLKKKTRNRNV